MSATVLPPPGAAPFDLRSKKSWRRTKSGIATGLMALTFAIVLIPLTMIVVNLLQRGFGALSWDFFTKEIPRPRAKGPGMGPAIVGTIVITGTAALLAVPLGILGAIYLHEYGRSSKPARVIRFLSYVMTGVPSIVMGLFIYAIFVVPLKQRSGFAGALALGALMLPIVIRSTEEMLKLVPNYLREASLALGTSKARTILTVVLPAAVPGITSGCLLAVARAAGETAPVLFTIGIVSRTNWALSGPNTTLAQQIFTNAGSIFPGAQERGYGAALTLVLLAFLFTLLARLVTARFATRR